MGSNPTLSDWFKSPLAESLKALKLPEDTSTIGKQWTIASCATAIVKSTFD